MSVHLHGDMTTPGSFRASDLRLFTTPRHLTKIEAAINKLPVPTDLHLVNLPKMPSPSKHFRSNGTDISTTKRIKERYKIKIDPDPDTLHVVFVDNEGRQRLPLTPWMTLHRVSHAFAQFVEGQDQYSKSEGWKTYDHMVKVFDEVRKRYTRRKKYSDGVSYTDSLCKEDLPPIFGTTSACRNSKLFQFGEIMHECFAQLFMTGSIKFKPAELVAYDILRHRYAVKRPEYLQEIDQKLADLAVYFEQKFNKWISDGKGKILVL
jgi:hypothetical protein